MPFRKKTQTKTEKKIFQKFSRNRGGVHLGSIAATRDINLTFSINNTISVWKYLNRRSLVANNLHTDVQRRRIFWLPRFPKFGFGIRLESRTVERRVDDADTSSTLKVKTEAQVPSLIIDRSPLEESHLLYVPYTRCSAAFQTERYQQISRYEKLTVAYHLAIHKACWKQTLICCSNLRVLSSWCPAVFLKSGFNHPVTFYL